MRAEPLFLAVISLAPVGCIREANRDLALPAAQEEPLPPAPPGESREVIVADQAQPADEGTEPAPPPAAPPVVAQPVMMQPEPILFQLGAGYGALGRLDLATCREQGLQPGYVHVRVTFRRSGHVVRAAVESPSAPPQQALDCISEQLAWTMVPVFDGGDVTLSKSFFVN